MLIMICANQAWNLVNFRSGLIEALIADGFRVMAVAPSDPVMADRLRAMGCEFAEVPFDASGMSPLRDLRTLLALYGLIGKHRPAAWLSWTIKPNIYGLVAARLRGVRSFPNISGLGTAFIRRNLLTKIVKQLYRTALGGAQVVFFQNEDDRALFVTEGLVRARNTRLLPGSGIDPAAFNIADNARPGPRRFLMIARLLADKGVREYVEAARQIRARWPDARFTLLGFLDVANRTAISRAEVDRWVAEGVISYHPPVEDVRPAIAAADCIVLPSYREGLSRVLLEAGAMRRPVVTSNVPGCRDIVSDGVNGYLCAPRDADSLAGALSRAAAMADVEWQRMAAAGRARVIAEFSQDRVIAGYRTALYEIGVLRGPTYD